MVGAFGGVVSMDTDAKLLPPPPPNPAPYGTEKGVGMEFFGNSGVVVAVTAGVAIIVVCGSCGSLTSTTS